MKDVYIRIRNLRQNNNLKQKHVAGHLGIPQQTYSNYERDKHELPARHVVSLAKLYHVSTDYILGTETARVGAFDFNATFVQDIPLKDVLINLTKLNRHNRLELIRFLSYLVSKQEKPGT